MSKVSNLLGKVNQNSPSCEPSVIRTLSSCMQAFDSKTKTENLVTQALQNVDTAVRKCLL